jgi:hypothetical protein
LLAFPPDWAETSCITARVIHGGLADARVGAEAIPAVAKAFGAGEIDLEPVDPNTRKDAIHVVPGGSTYTCDSIAAFLGWTKKANDGGTEPTRACRPE